MNRFVRRGFLGAFAGATAGTPMLFLSSNGGFEFAMAIAAGSLYGACVPAGPRHLCRQHHGRSFYGDSSLGYRERHFSSLVFEQTYGVERSGDGKSFLAAG